MVKIITEDLVKKIYEITGREVSGDFVLKNEVEIWYGIRASTSEKYFHEELLETFETKELAIEAGETLGGLFSGKFIGED